LARHPNAVDFWRGFALVSIFTNHIPGIYYERFTHRNLSISDSAELFVFLAGWALALVAVRPQAIGGLRPLLAKLCGRAVTIYAAQLLISSAAIAMLAMATIFFDNPLLLEWHNAAAVFYDPVKAHIGLVFLTHQLGYFDILPLYVVLMLAAPLIIIIHRTAPFALLPASLALYLATLALHIPVPAWPNQGEWLFNPLAWQLVFVLGFVMAGSGSAAAFVRSHIRVIRIAAVPAVLAGAAMPVVGFWPDPTLMPEPKLLFVVSKTYVTPIRLIQFLALIAVFSAIYPYIARLSGAAVRFLSMLGRNSLPVFCAGSLLSLGGQIVRFVYNDGIFVDTIILLAGIVILGLIAWMSEWPKHSEGGNG
jgi:hypothetical protein